MNSLESEMKEIRQRRLELGISKAELTRRSGVTVCTIRNSEAGKNIPKWETRQKLRKALEMPEKRTFSTEERNALLLEMLDQITWIIRNNAAVIRRVGLDSNDVYQEMALQMIRAIDRFEPDGPASVKTFVERNINYAFRRMVTKYCMHGLSGHIEYPLPPIYVISYEEWAERIAEDEDGS